MTDTNTDHNSDIARTLGIDSFANRSKHLKRWLSWGAFVLVMALITVKWSTSGSAGTIQYKTEEVRRGTLTVTVTATGSLQPTNQVDVGSELSGTIKSVEADYNDLVKVGQVLAKLDTSKLEAQVLQSKASLASAGAKVLQAQATVKETRNALARLKKVWGLSGNKAVSQSDLDAAEAALERAQADETGARASVSQAEAVLRANETDLAKMIIHSPINGIVLTRSVEPGQTVAASLQAPVLFTLAEDLTQMELHVDVDEADVGLVKEGQEAIFTVDAYPDRTFPARITQVRYGSQTVDGVVTYETVLNVDNSDLSLRPGMTATADITVQEIGNAILVPNAALRFAPPRKESPESSGGGGVLSKLLPRPPSPPSKGREATDQDKKHQRVWTLRDGQPVAVPVRIGATDGTLTEISDGAVEAGTALVVDTGSVSR